MRALDKLARRFALHLDIVRDRQLTHATALAGKRRAHIVIDECVTGSYHRNSLEGLVAGCVVLNGVGLLPAVADAFRLCAGEDTEIPFIFANLNNLEAVLASLIERGAEALTAEGVRNRAWMEKHWDFERQWTQFWEPSITRALAKSTRQSVITLPSAENQAEKISRPTSGVARPLQGGRCKRCHLSWRRRAAPPSCRVPGEPASIGRS